MNTSFSKMSTFHQHTLSKRDIVDIYRHHDLVEHIDDISLPEFLAPSFSTMTFVKDMSVYSLALLGLLSIILLVLFKHIVPLCFAILKVEFSALMRIQRDFTKIKILVSKEVDGLNTPIYQTSYSLGSMNERVAEVAISSISPDDRYVIIDIDDEQHGSISGKCVAVKTLQQEA